MKSAALPILRVGDEKGGAKSLMTASGVLTGIDHLIEWNIFAAAAPLLDALNAGAIDCGWVVDAFVGRNHCPAGSGHLRRPHLRRPEGPAARQAGGLSVSDINLVFLSPGDARAALVSRAIDADGTAWASETGLR